MDLPTATKGSSRQDVDSVEILVVDGAYRVDGVPVTLIELESEFQRFADMNDQPVLAIRAPADAPYQVVLTLIDLSKKYKLSKVQFVNTPEE